MEMNIPAPSNWQTFENLCLRLWSSIWGTMAQKVGHSGQKQHGIDIIGVSAFNGGLCAVQCKLKDYNIGSQLTTKEIDEETESSKEIEPHLKHLTFATTACRKYELQEHCLQMNTKPDKVFDVDVWSWDDIQAEIQYRKEIMDYFYHELPIEHTNIAVYDTYFTIPRLAAFFSRDCIKNMFSRDDRNLLCNLAFEIFDNANKYGKASKFILKVENKELQLIDNGTKYDYTKLQGEQGGAITMRQVLGKFNGVTYKYTKGENQLSIPLPDIVEEADTIELIMDGSTLATRKQMQMQILAIPIGVKEVIINMTSLIPCSGAIDFCEYLDKSDKKVTIYLPRKYLFKDMLKSRYPKITFIER